MTVPARRFSRKALTVGVLLSLAGPSMAACDDADDDDGRSQETRFQCAIVRDGVEEAVDCDAVDDNNGTVIIANTYHPVFIHTYPVVNAGPAYAPGTRLPAGGHRIGYKDTSGRTRWGLPPSGRVANNTVKTNVVGKGGVPAARAGG